MKADLRFWWRALDAQTPDPVSPSASLSGLWHYPKSRTWAAPENPFALKIHKSQRRRRRGRTNTWLRGIFAIATVSIALSSAAITVYAPHLDSASLQDQFTQKSRAILRTLGFGIDQVFLTGQRYTADSDVYDALDLPNVPTFAEFDAPAALKRIERIAWVDTAQITRAYPSTLKIAIQERIPAAIWARAGQSLLVDMTGRVLGPLPKESGWDLPLVSGEGANIELAALLIALQNAKDIAAVFHHAERIAERRWRLVLKNGSQIELAADREAEGLDRVLHNRQLTAALAGAPVTIDVRTPARAAVRALAVATKVQEARRNG